MMLLGQILEQHPRGAVNDALRRTGGAAGNEQMIEPDSTRSSSGESDTHELQE